MICHSICNRFLHSCPLKAISIACGSHCSLHQATLPFTTDTFLWRWLLIPLPFCIIHGGISKNWFFKSGFEFISFRLKFHRSVKIFSFCYRAIIVIFGVHYLKVSFILFLQIFSIEPFFRLWIYGLSSIPVIFDLFVVKSVFADSIGWRFI